MTIAEIIALARLAGGGSSSGSGGGDWVTTLHINVTAVNRETMEATFTADKTPLEMNAAALNGPVWCVVSFPAGILAEESISLGVAPSWYGIGVAFGGGQMSAHNSSGNNIIFYAVRPEGTKWIIDLRAFGT